MEVVSLPGLFDLTRFSSIEIRGVAGDLLRHAFTLKSSPVEG
jgi:hypothetical protein